MKALTTELAGLKQQVAEMIDANYDKGKVTPPFRSKKLSSGKSPEDIGITKFGKQVEGDKTTDQIQVSVAIKQLKSDKDKIPVKITGFNWCSATDANAPFYGCIAYARQDHMMAVVNSNNCTITGKVTKFAQCVALHPKSNIILSGGMDNATTMWKKEDGKNDLQMTKVITEHDGYICSLEFCEGGDKFMSTSGDSDTRLFDVERKTSTMRFCGHSKDAQSLSFVPDGSAPQVFATCSSDKTVRLWDIRTEKCTAVMTTESELNTCSWFPNGSAIACGGEKDKTFFYDVRALKQIAKYARNNQKTASTCFSASGSHLYVGHDDGAIIIWDVFGNCENKAYVAKVEAHSYRDFKTDKIPNATRSRVQEMKLSPHGVLTSAGFDGHLRLWKGAKGEFN